MPVIVDWFNRLFPETVTFSSGAVINYSYAANGTKLREARTASSTTTTTDYTGNLILENGTRSRLLYDGGYVSVSNSGYHFFLTDHLGSVRVVANTSGTAEEYNHYYPLGGPIAQYSSSTSLQPIKYQGKEWSADKGLQLYDFGARRYDPATGRWLSQDPLSEKYYAHSPYLFCGANPMRFVDPEGMNWYRAENGTYEYYEGQLSNEEMIARSYTNDMGYSFVENNKYYGLFGNVQEYNKLGKLYEKIDLSLIRYANYLKENHTPLNSFDTEAIPEASVDFTIEGLAPGHYPFVYKGISFSSEESGTFFNAIDSNSNGFRTVKTAGDPNIVIQYLPIQSRTRRGLGQNKRVDSPYVGYILLGTPRSGASFDSLQILFTRDNARAFLQSYSNLFGINETLR